MADTIADDLRLQLPRDMFQDVITRLCAALPAPLPDTPETRARRDRAAMAQVAALLPADADEANLAALHVAAMAEATDCLRRARASPDGAAVALRCSEQAARMSRQALALRAMLLRVQAARAKREADTAALDQAAWTEHCAIGLMAQAFAASPADLAAAPAGVAAVDEPAAAAASAAKAEPNALVYPARAALISGLADPPSATLATAIAAGVDAIPRELAVSAEV